MDKNDAKDLLDLFYRRTKSTALLTDAQRNTVLSTIMRTYDDASEVTISDVRRIVEKEVAPPAPRKRNRANNTHHRLPHKSMPSNS